MTETMMPDPVTEVTGGVDTHADFDVAAVVDHLGAVLGTARFETSRSGYQQLLAWMNSYGPVKAVGVEGTGSWGVGLARHLNGHGVEVREVVRPNRQSRRRYGKSDQADAVAAARAVLSGEAEGAPRGNTGIVESVRALKIVRDSAMKQRTMVVNQVHALVITCPDSLRRTLTGVTMAKTVKLVVGYRPADSTDPTQATKLALKTLGRRYQYLTEEIKTLDAELEALVEEAAPPGLLDMCGVGTQNAARLIITIGSHPERIKTEGSLAALCGTSPVDMSSGKQQRHRLNRGGDRQANSALYMIAIVRLGHHEPTKEYVQKRVQQGLTKPEIIRCLKRYIARDIWRIYTQQKHANNPT